MIRGYLHQNQRHQISICWSCLCVCVCRNKRMADKMKWQKNQHSSEKKGKTKMEKSEWTMKTIYERWNVVKRSIRWDASEKKNEKKGKSHQNMTIGNSIAVYFYGTVQTVTKILYKNIIISWTLKFVQPCVLFARLSPSKAIHLVVLPVLRSMVLHKYIFE